MAARAGASWTLNPTLTQPWWCCDILYRGQQPKNELNSLHGSIVGMLLAYTLGLKGKMYAGESPFLWYHWSCYMVILYPGIIYNVNGSMAAISNDARRDAPHQGLRDIGSPNWECLSVGCGGSHSMTHQGDRRHCRLAYEARFWFFGLKDIHVFWLSVLFTIH